MSSRALCYRGGFPIASLEYDGRELYTRLIRRFVDICSLRGGADHVYFRSHGKDYTCVITGEPGVWEVKTGKKSEFFNFLS